MPFVGAMSPADIDGVVEDFRTAAVHAREAGFDAVELHLGHGYLLSQFISPLFNRRGDAFGGSIENRMRFPRLVVRKVRNALGAGFPVLAKINLSDGHRRGLSREDATRAGVMLEEDGVTALVTSGGLVSRTPFYLLRGDIPLKQMIEVEPSRTAAGRVEEVRIAPAKEFVQAHVLPRARTSPARGREDPDRAARRGDFTR